MLTPEDLEPLDALLRRHGLDGIAEEPFPHDGWSGASMSLLRRGDGDRFVLKRDSLERDWIARSTLDGSLLREVWFAAAGPDLPAPIRAPYLGAARDVDGVAVLMPDLSDVLFDWEAAISVEALDRVLAALAELHSNTSLASGDLEGQQWCPWRERVTLICRASLEREGPARDAVADRILPGWDAFDRLAPPAARDLVNDLGEDPDPLLAALASEPATLLHGDLKLANVGLSRDGSVDLVDWQMVMVAPVAIELGWFLVSNVTALPLPPTEVLQRYWEFRGLDGSSQNELAILVGLLLRGWRKGYDAESGRMLASGMTAADDLRWWCERAVAASARLG